MEGAVEGKWKSSSLAWTMSEIHPWHLLYWRNLGQDSLLQSTSVHLLITCELWDYCKNLNEMIRMQTLKECLAHIQQLRDCNFYYACSHWFLERTYNMKYPLNLISPGLLCCFFCLFVLSFFLFVFPPPEAVHGNNVHNTFRATCRGIPLILWLRAY